MYKLTKEFSFDAAHMLDGHCGKCNNLHGHTYKLKVYIFSNELLNNKSSEGMVIDFKDLKSIVNPIIDELDHSYIYNSSNDIENSIANLLIKENKKTYKLTCRSTCENLSKHIYERLINNLKGYKLAIKLYETPTSYCLYSE